MFRMLTIAAVGAVAAAGVAAVAIAQTAHDTSGGHGPMMQMMMAQHFTDLDRNKDGVLTRDEFLAHPSEAFDRMDANHDGRLTQAELAAAHGPGRHMVCKQMAPGDKQAKDVPCAGMPPMGAMMMMHHLAMLDADHDGKVSMEEVEAKVREHFRALDKNHDGYISEDEMPQGNVMFEHHSGGR